MMAVMMVPKNCWKISMTQEYHCYTTRAVKGFLMPGIRDLQLPSGKYIAYLDSDNLWDSRYLAAMIGAFLELPDAEAIYSGQLLFKGEQKHPFAVRFGSFNRSLLTNRNYIDINALCHTKELYNRIGGFDETLIRLVDYDLDHAHSRTSSNVLCSSHAFTLLL